MTGMEPGPTMAGLTPDQVADQLIRRRVYELAKAALPELEMPKLEYEVRTLTRGGYWRKVTPQKWLESRAHQKLEQRIVATYDAAHRLVMLFGGDS